MNGFLLMPHFSTIYQKFCVILLTNRQTKTRGKWKKRKETALAQTKSNLSSRIKKRKNWSASFKVVFFSPSTSFTFQPGIMSPCDRIKTPWSDVSRPNTSWKSRLISPLTCLCAQVCIFHVFFLDHFSIFLIWYLSLIQVFCCWKNI